MQDNTEDRIDETLKDLDWDTVSLRDKVDVMAAVLVTYKDEVDAVSDYMTEQERLSANMELSYMLGMLGAVEGAEGLNKAVIRLSQAEEALQTLCLTKLAQKAADQISQIEKGLMVATGIIPPEKIIEIRHKLDEVREMEMRQDRGQVEAVLQKLSIARKLLSGAHN